jgi:cytidylate kinase
LDIANKGPCVIVGRCADYILRDNPECIKVFIRADIPCRAKRIVEQYGESEVAPERRLKDKDKRRAAYYQFYTDRKWGDIKNYDMVLSTSSLGIEKCADIIAEVYKIK